jgi:hypothetical protein
MFAVIFWAFTTCSITALFVNVRLVTAATIIANSQVLIESFTGKGILYYKSFIICHVPTIRTS